MDGIPDRLCHTEADDLDWNLISNICEMAYQNDICADKATDALISIIDTAPSAHVRVNAARLWISLINNCRDLDLLERTCPRILCEKFGWVFDSQIENQSVRTDLVVALSVAVGDHCANDLSHPLARLYRQMAPSSFSENECPPFATNLPMPSVMEFSYGVSSIPLISQSTHTNC